MGKRLDRISLWVRRRSHLPVILVGGVVLLVLFFDEDTSLTRNMSYDNEIRSLRHQIQVCRDSAEYYKLKRERIISGKEDLEHVAREQYNMQLPTEDVFVIKEK